MEEEIDELRDLQIVDVHVGLFTSDDQLGLRRLFKLYVPGGESVDATASQIRAGEIGLDRHRVQQRRVAQIRP